MTLIPSGSSQPVKQLPTLLLVLGICDDAVLVQIGQLADLLGDRRRRRSAGYRLDDRGAVRHSGVGSVIGGGE